MIYKEFALYRLRCLSWPHFYYILTCKIEAFISFIFSDQNCVNVGHGCFLADPSCYTYAVTITIACLNIFSENSFLYFQNSMYESYHLRDLKIAIGAELNR